MPKPPELTINKDPFRDPDLTDEQNEKVDKLVNQGVIYAEAYRRALGRKPPETTPEGVEETPEDELPAIPKSPEEVAQLVEETRAHFARSEERRVAEKEAEEATRTQETLELIQETDPNKRDSADSS
jgi:hypothetical protein